jgi:hypothetical protein
LIGAFSTATGAHQADLQFRERRQEQPQRKNKAVEGWLAPDGSGSRNRHYAALKGETPSSGVTFA